MAKAQTATWNREDRDLLVELKTTLAAVQNDIKEIKDGTAAKLRELETDKLSRSDATRIQVSNDERFNKIGDTLEERGIAIKSLQDSRIEFRTQMKTWTVIGGFIFTVFQIGLAIYLNK
jgi:hypothetical protein